MTEKIDIIYCYRNRDLRRVKNSFDSLALQNNKNFNVIFVDYGSDGKIAEAAKIFCAEYNFCNYVFIDTQGKTWSRAEALNYGFLVSQANYVFTSDIDMVFKNNFVEHLYKIQEKNTASFFAVGYLSERDSESINLQNFNKIKYTKSEDFALGMVFVSKEILNKINGYNAFYSLWGAEDNDIKYRIEQAGYKTTFVDQEIFMLHQFHPNSGTDASVLPKGWIQFMKDYQAHYKKGGTGFIGLNQIALPLQRPAKSAFISAKTEFEIIQARNLFIRYRLTTDLTNDSSEKVLAYSFKTSEIKNSFFNQSGKHLNGLFKLLGIPLIVNSLHESQYVSKNTVRDEIYFVLKSLENFVADYYLTIEQNEIKLIIVRK